MQDINQIKQSLLYNNLVINKNKFNKNSKYENICFIFVHFWVIETPWLITSKWKWFYWIKIAANFFWSAIVSRLYFQLRKVKIKLLWDKPLD